MPESTNRRLMVLSLSVTALLLTGCQWLGPMPIQVRDQHFSAELIDSENPQIEIGRANKVIDGVGWTLGIPDKLLLWDRRVDRHKISETTLSATADYLVQNNLPHVKVRANQYAPLRDWKRLTKNKTMPWLSRYSLGTLSVAGEALIPGRIFGGDHYNPFTQTIHLYSDVPAIALHEAAHAKDFTRRKHQGLYATAYLVVPLWHETVATEDVLAYLDERGEPSEIREAHRILYPAYGTYVGSAAGGLSGTYALPVYLSAVASGHINGRLLAGSVEDRAAVASGVESAATLETSEIRQASATSADPIR